MKISASTNPTEPFYALFEAERAHLVRYACFRLGDINDAEDATQDLFLRIQHLYVNGTSVGPKNLKGYLYRSLSNLCVSRLRQKIKSPLVPMNEKIDCCDCSEEDSEQIIQHVLALLSKIPEEQAEVIRLRIYADLSFQEIADTLEVPLPTVKSRFLYGLQKLKHCLPISNFQ